MPPVLRNIVILLLSLSIAQGKPQSWAQVKKKSEYLAARTAIADHLPQLAIPNLLTLLDSEKISDEARSELRTLLGEAFLRNGQPQKALENLNHKAPDYAPETAFWRAHALQQLGRLSEAADTFALVDSKKRHLSSQLNEATLRTLLNEPAKAIAILDPLLKTEDPTLRDQVLLRLTTNYLDQNQPAEASASLAKISKQTPHSTYLQGRLHLLKKERQPAVELFQRLTSNPSPDWPVPSDLYNASILALADSLALGDQAELAANFLLDLLESNPDSPIVRPLFARLRKWQKGTPEAITRLKSLLPAASPSEEPATTAPLPELLIRQRLGHLLLKQETPEAQKEGRELLLALIKQTKDPSLLSRAQRDLGLDALRREQLDDATSAFSSMVESAPSSDWKAYALALKGATAFQKKDPKASANAFLEAAKKAPADQKQTLVFNAGLSLIESGDFSRLKKLSEDPALRASLLLEQGLVLHAKNNPAARAPLERFLAETQNHSREAEARLTLAESATFLEPKNEALAKAQLRLLKFDSRKQTDLALRRILASLALNENAELALGFLAKNPNHPDRSQIRFELARYYHRTQNAGEEYRTLEALIVSDPDHELANSARMLSARAGLKINTPAAFEKSFNHYHYLRNSKSPLAIEAAIEHAAALNDNVEEPEGALEILTPFLKKKNLPPRDHRRILALAAAATNKQQNYKKSLSYYDQLLAMPDLPRSWRNKASYQRGRVLEELGKSDQALESYLQVINQQLAENSPQDKDWESFDKCGISAIKLLSKKENWRAAIKVAEKIANSGSPQADARKAQVKRLRLDHMIWED